MFTRVKLLQFWVKRANGKHEDLEYRVKEDVSIVFPNSPSLQVGDSICSNVDTTLRRKPLPANTTAFNKPAVAP
jgi:hypothetical protein